MPDPKHCATCTCRPDEVYAALPWKAQPLTAYGLCPAFHRIGEGEPVSDGSTIRTGSQDIGCCIKGHHDGPHKDYLVEPCQECGAWDEHPMWCGSSEREWQAWVLLRALGFPRLPQTYPHTLRFASTGPDDDPSYWIEVPSPVTVGTVQPATVASIEVEG